MKIFVFEYVTGGGLYREPLPEGLSSEGDLMLQVLLADLAEIPNVELLTSRDERLPALDLPCKVVTVSAGVDFSQVFSDLVNMADAVWLVAPESREVLHELSKVVLTSGKQLLGSSPHAIEVATYKSATNSALARSGISVAPIVSAEGNPLSGWGPWVAKPDDGAGCEDTYLFNNAQELMCWVNQGNHLQTHVIQPFIPGEPASLSMLCLDGHAWLLSCNRQCIHIKHDRFSYHGSVINGMKHLWGAFEQLAQQIAMAIPGLAGYVGVDLIVNGAELTVIEINPRLTTSYVGLRSAMACNPARMILDMFYNDDFELPQTMARNIVEITLDE